jgi:membrane protease subunit HflK
MPWNDNAGGGGPWGSGGGGQNNNNNNPWGRGPNGPGRGPSGGGQEPDLEELVRRFQQWLGGKGPRGGGRGGSGKGGSGGGLVGVVAGLIAIGVITAASVYQVGPGEAGVVQRFGEYVRTTGAGLRIKLPYPIETVLLPNVTDTRPSNRLDRKKPDADPRREHRRCPSPCSGGSIHPEGGVRDFLFNVRDVQDHGPRGGRKRHA